jgi:hypothetical protein
VSAPTATMTPTPQEREHVNDYCLHHCGTLALSCPFGVADCVSVNGQLQDLPDEGDSRSAVP